MPGAGSTGRATRSGWGDEAAEARAPCHGEHWSEGAIYPILPAGRLSFTVHSCQDQTRQQIEAFPQKFFFSSDHPERYEPFSDRDFGPVSLDVVHSFCLYVRQFASNAALAERELVYYTPDKSVELRTNTAFLLAAYLVLDGPRLTPEEAWAPFEGIAGAFIDFRDVTDSNLDCDLPVLDCLRGLHKAASCGCLSVDAFDSDEYCYLDNPLNADMHMCTPKLAAFRGPGVGPAVVGPSFPPSHFVQLFRSKGITAVVRLISPGDPSYDPAAFSQAGISHHDLADFQDLPVPSPALVRKFLEIVAGEQGIAVHCSTGLGRTGCIISASLMWNQGFTASECIGWLRVVRPGSVYGSWQKLYLDALEEALAEARALGPEAWDKACAPSAPLSGSCGGPRTGHQW